MYRHKVRLLLKLPRLVLQSVPVKFPSEHLKELGLQAPQTSVFWKHAIKIKIGCCTYQEVNDFRYLVVLYPTLSS